MKFNFKKKYGQNFLNDEKVISNIANSIHPNENDLVIEIGPGSGALTKYLKGFNCNVICYEIDTELDQYLSKYKSDKLNIIYNDFLKCDVISDISKIKYENLYIIGNLPYYITTPIILRIIELNLNIKEMVFMVQKEVAKRFSSKPGNREYGSITVLLNYFYNIESLFVVNRSKFTPVPNVDSAVIKFNSKESLSVDFDKFNKFIKDAFLMKRKNLRNNLKNYDLDKIDSILSKYGFSISNRAEEIPLEVFIEIINNY